MRECRWILLACGFVLFANLGAPALWDEDEPKNAECAREMLERGDWVVPRFNYELRTDKPVLIYWLMMGSYSLFGVNEFAARFPSAILAAGTCLLTYGIGRTLFRPAVGMWSGLILATAFWFAFAGRASTPDSTLVFCTTLAMLLFVAGVHQRIETSELVRRRDYVPVYAAMGLATLAKGPVGILLPGLVMLFYLRIRSEVHSTTTTDVRTLRQRVIVAVKHWMVPRPWLEALWSMKPFTAAIVIGAIALPWYILVGIRTDGVWLTGFLGWHNMQRFLQPLENHRGPFFYHALAILVFFLPWSVFLPQALLNLGRRISNTSTSNAGELFIACWTAVYFCFFSLAATKLPNYLLPAYPALALATGLFIEQWITNPQSISSHAIGRALWVLVAVSAGLIIVLPIAMGTLVHGEQWLGIIGIFPTAGALLAVRFWRRSDAKSVAITTVISTTALFTLLFAVAAVHVSRHHNGPTIVAELKQSGHEHAQIATLNYNTPSLTFYSQERIENFTSPEQAIKFLEGTDDSCLITTDESLPKLRHELTSDIEVLIRQPRFLRRGYVVALGRKAANIAEIASRIPPPATSH